jgi:hypothetical protein
MVIALPEDSFDEIAVDLVQYAQSAREAALAGEILLARGQLVSPGMRHTIEELRRSARRCAELQRFFRDAIPHEQEFRDFVAGLDAHVADDGMSASREAAA